MIADLFKNSEEDQLRALQKFRKLLSRDPNPPIDEVINAEILDRIVDFLRNNNNPTLQVWSHTHTHAAPPSKGRPFKFHQSVYRSIVWGRMGCDQYCVRYVRANAQSGRERCHSYIHWAAEHSGRRCAGASCLGAWKYRRRLVRFTWPRIGLRCNATITQVMPTNCSA